MEHYEIVFLVHPKHSDQVPSIVDKYKSIVQGRKGHVHRFEDWGLRSLAYPIQKLKNAHYVLLNLECDADSLREIKEDFRFNEALLRNLILSKSEAITDPSPVALSVKRVAEKTAGEQSEQSEPVDRTETKEATSPGENSGKSHVIATETLKSGDSVSEQVSDGTDTDGDDTENKSEG